MKKFTLLPLVSVLGLTVSATAIAEDQWYFAPSLSYVLADDDRVADDDFGLQLGVGQVINESWNIEFSAVMDTLDLESGAGEYKQRGIQVDGLYFFDRDRSIDPYLVGGIGGLQTKLGTNKDTNMMANVGAGVMHMIGDSISLRADARYRLDDDDKSVAMEDRFGDWIVNIGLAIPFGGSKAAPAAAPVAAAMAEPEPVVMDSDGDGVSDANDRCKNTVAGAKVNANGCEVDSDKDGVVDRMDRCPATPAGAKVDAKGCELDGDKDGVVDRLDRCPSTPAGVKVDAKGCELDSDKDGVRDSADRCANTAAGVKVDVKGCEIQDVIVLKGVKFNSGSADLTEGSKTELNEVAATLKKHAELKVEVGGYTDNTGSRAFNVSLSQRRAQSVVDFLVSQGVNAGNLSAKGYGPASPIADNGTAAGRAENRRVELHIAQ